MSDVLGQILGKEKSYFINKPSKEWILEDTTIGVEVEVEGVNLRALNNRKPDELVKYWTWHEDQSLHDMGCEFTFRQPMFGEDARVAIKDLCDFSVGKGWKYSQRCGIHVHMDARDLSRHQLLGLIGYYIIYEPALYSWVGKSRHANNFCVPWFKYEGAVLQAIQILTALRMGAQSEISRDDVLATCDSFHRYGGLNLKSLALFGSLEFRHLETVLDYEIIKRWINILMGLKRAALLVPESSMQIVNEIKRTGIKRMGQQIFGEEAAVMWEDKDLTDKIKEWTLPTAAYLISEVLHQTDPRDLQWEPGGLPKPKEKKDHPGFLAWRKANYPKDLPQPPKEKPPKETIDVRTERYQLPNRGTLRNRTYAPLYGGNAEQATEAIQRPAAWWYGLTENQVLGRLQLERGTGTTSIDTAIAPPQGEDRGGVWDFWEALNGRWYQYNDMTLWYHGYDSPPFYVRTETQLMPHIARPAPLIPDEGAPTVQEDGFQVWDDGHIDRDFDPEEHDDEGVR